MQFGCMPMIGLESNASGFYTIWVYRKGGQMTGKEQLIILAFVMPKVIESIENQPKARHSRASATHSL